MTMTKKRLSLIHVARNQLGLTDEDYRAILMKVAGVSSSTDLDGAGFDAVMAYFQRLGFTSTRKRETFGERPGMATSAQVALIRKLWGEFTGGEGTEAALGKWLERTFQVSALRFLPAGSAHKAIGALKTMTSRREEQRQHA